jgi:hypothetical protein
MYTDIHEYMHMDILPHWPPILDPKLSLDKYKHSYWISGSHSGDHEEYCRLGCNAVHSRKSSDVTEEHTASIFGVEE